MSLVVVASAKGAPGATTVAAALAHVWPGPVDPLLVEVDPFGGDLAARLGLPTEPGLATLAAETHRTGGTMELGAHLQVAHGLRIVPAPVGQAAGRAAALLGPALGWALVDLATAGDVIVDVGRVDGTAADGPVGTGIIAAADAVVVVCGSRTTAELSHALAAVTELTAAGLQAGAVLVGGRRDVECAQLLPCPVFGVLPHDPRGAAALGGAATRPWLLERLPIIRAARAVAGQLLEICVRARQGDTMTAAPTPVSTADAPVDLRGAR